MMDSEHHALSDFLITIAPSSKEHKDAITVQLALSATRLASMNHTKSLMSPAQALLRVFCPIAPTSITQPRSYQNTRTVKQSTPAQVRQLLTIRPQNFANNNTPKTPVDQFPDVNRDYGIQARYIRMPTPDGGLSPPESMRVAMSRVRQGLEHLVQISKVDEDGMAICRIMTIADLLKQKREQQRVTKEQKKSSKHSAPKQIEVNWAIGPNDLEHKLTQLKGFIQDGKKVEIVLASKRKQRKATPEEGREVLRKIRAKIKEADAREINPTTGGEIGSHTVLTVRKKGLD